VKHLGVVGVGIGGSEQLYPPALFQEVFAQAQTLGFHTTAHAGEAAGPESVWGALRELAVERIGHGTRASEDPALVGFLVEHQIPLEMCPMSNVRTGVVSSLAEHPIRRFFDLGVLVTVNTDDPKMFGTSLAQEYLLLETELGFASDEIQTIMLNAVRASWLPEVRKNELAQSVRDSPGWDSLAEAR
jgi:adenosine deaminase